MNLAHICLFLFFGIAYTIFTKTWMNWFVRYWMLVGGSYSFVRICLCVKVLMVFKCLYMCDSKLVDQWGFAHTQIHTYIYIDSTSTPCIKVDDAIICSNDVLYRIYLSVLCCVAHNTCTLYSPCFSVLAVLLLPRFCVQQNNEQVLMEHIHFQFQLFPKLNMSNSLNWELECSFFCFLKKQNKKSLSTQYD